jgi:primosomal replication protein N
LIELDCSNRFVIDGELAELEDLRYTPAGIARIGLKIRHASTRQEAGTSRQVACEVPALALGEMALRASRMRPGQQITLEGFMAQRSLHSKQLVLHIDNIRLKEGA